MTFTYNLKLVFLDKTRKRQYRQILIEADESVPFDNVFGAAVDILMSIAADSPGMGGGIDVVGLAGIPDVTPGSREGAYAYLGE